MSLTKAILEHWAADEPLNDQLPVERVSVGTTPDTSTPYAVLELNSVVPVTATNAGHAMEQTIVQLDIWDGHYDSGLTTVEYVKAAFDWSDLVFGAGQGSARFRCRQVTTKHHDNRLWQFRVELCATSVG